MKPRLVASSGARAIAADVVARVLDDGAWAQPALASALSASAMDARDRALCTELVYGTLRWAASLEKSLLRSADKPGRGLDKRIRPILLVAAYQLQHLSERIPPHAAVHEAVDAVRAVRPGLEGFANALLRRLGSPVHTTLSPSASAAEYADALGIPPMLADAVLGVVGDAGDVGTMRAALEGLNARPTTWAYAFDGPRALAADAAGHAFVPMMSALAGGNVVDVGGFRAGAFIVMDPGSAVAALLVGAGAGQRVIDLCAAPGSKTVVLASTGAHVVAIEKSDKRATRIAENAERCRVKERVEVVVADASSLPAKLRAEKVDAVLLDAPCTGLGTTRRKPEIKMRRTAADVAEDAKLQRALLTNALGLVRPGGVVVYSVCSPLPAEGLDVVNAVLASAAGAGFTVDDARRTLPWLPAATVDERGFVHLLPHRDDCDAFFCARLRKGRA